MWIEAEDAHLKYVNLANANEITIHYTGAHGYKVVASMIGGTDCHIKKCLTEKEATDFLKDIYDRLL